MQPDQLFSSLNDKPKNQFDLGKGLISKLKKIILEELFLPKTE